MMIQLSSTSQPRGMAISNAPKGNWATSLIRILLAASAIDLAWARPRNIKVPYDRISDSHGEQYLARAEGVAVTSWEDIEPSTSLEWTRCFQSEGPFMCARLTVPMDYQRPLEESPDHPKVHLALIMIPGGGRGEGDNVPPANFSVSPLLINPGGPGGSAVAFIRQLGMTVRTTIGEERDIIGFDPRGVGSSTPRADCFLQKTMGRTEPSEDEAYFRRRAFLFSVTDGGSINTTAEALPRLDTVQRLVNDLCQVKDEEEGENGILRHVATRNAARDMLSIIQAWDKWRGEDSGADGSVDQGEEENPLDTRGKLVYWGFSYGTLLGATYASMFPDKVGRVILDGVLNADRYVAPIWDDSLPDTDAVWDKFFVYCHEAGPQCAFADPSDSVQDLRDRYAAIAARLRAEPIPIVSAVDKYPFLITYSDLENLIFVSLYMPITYFPVLAEVLAWMEGRVSRTIEYSDVRIEGLCLPRPAQYPEDSQRGVMCGDKVFPLNESLPELQQRFENLALSSEFAGVWMSVGMQCSRYGVPVSDEPLPWGQTAEQADQPVERSTAQALASREEDKIKLSYPLLMATNTLDPVTPMAAALRMAQKFEGTRLLEQKAEGHATLAASSVCTMMVIRDYLNGEALPDEADIANGKWTVCDAENFPWSEPGVSPSLQDLINSNLLGRSVDEPDKALKSERTVESERALMARSCAELRKRFAVVNWNDAHVYGRQVMSSSMKALLQNLSGM